VNSELEIDAWLRGGGLVITANERAARFLLAEYHRRRRAEGLSAWRTPNIQDWQNFVCSEWEKRNPDGRLILNSLQEQSLWARVIPRRESSMSLLEGPRYRVADLAVSAHQLICAYAPQFLTQSARRGWQQDAAEFSAWLAEFDETCRSDGLISAARLPLELIALLENETGDRSQVLLAGFDRVLPTQRRLFDAWGDSRELQLAAAASRADFLSAGDPASELAACAIWCQSQLVENSNARLLVIAQDVSKRRGEYERAFLRYAGAENSAVDAGRLFEFSLGISLAEIALARSAGLVLHWLIGLIEEHEIDWLLSSGFTVVNAGETLALAAFVGALRLKDWQRPHWTLAEFLRQKPGTALPEAWVARMARAQDRLREMARRPQNPLKWAELVPQLLEVAGWPGARPLGSVEFQVLQRWQQTVDDLGSLGFHGGPATWSEFLANFDRAVNAALFAPESQGAPILISGPVESAGLVADAVWFFGADEENWPPRGATHPLLPIAVQRNAGMPHTSPQADWNLAAATTRRLLAAASKIHFSYARQTDGVERRPSQLIAQLAGEPRQMPAALLPEPAALPIALPFFDDSLIPFPAGVAQGGSDVLTFQSQCAFKAFAAVRLGAAKWDPAQAGLTGGERGRLLHEVMHRVWAGPPAGVCTQAELAAKSDLKEFVAGHVRDALRDKTPARARDSMPARYLELEGQRLTALITEWLRYEQARAPFAVEKTEAKASPAIAGLELNLRLDRVDRLNDDSLLVIDYKTGNVKPGVWDLPRPDDVQLPLYANFGLEPGAGNIGGLVFAKLRTGDCRFYGRVRDARATLRRDLRGNTDLVKNPLKPEDLAKWRDEIEQLAEDFIAGRADVNPREYPKTCERCGLQALCRIEEMRDLTGRGEDADALESDDD